MELTAYNASNFRDTHGDFVSRHPAPAAWVRDFRAMALDSFVAAGLPDRRHEEWKYTSLRTVAEGRFRPGVAGATPDPAAILGMVGEHDISLVFVDGNLSTSLSRIPAGLDGLTITPYAEALIQREADLRPLLERSVPGDGHPFLKLANAFVGAGVFIEVNRTSHVSRPVHILHLVTGRQEQVAFFPRVTVLARPGSALDLVETFAGQGAGAYLTCAAAEIQIEQDAAVRHVRIQREGLQASHFGVGRIWLGSGSRYESLNYCQGARLCRNDIDIVAGHSGADVILDGLYLAGKGQHVDNHTSVDHVAPNSGSNQLYKGVLRDDGRAVFNGKIFVRQAAQLTRAFQMNKSLLLSDEAEIDTKPQLQIDADDVKCSHGAAVGQLARDEIFYCMSRGIRRAEAVRILSQAFVDEVLLRCNVPGVRERLISLSHSFFEDHA